jgi:asparagine synthase (glutamine-hydrolysing)
MCGIAGILNLDGRPVNGLDVRSMTRAIAHRGPDGEEIHVDGPLGLGHRRLAILDLTEMGQQPMSYANGRYWITYNGEVYNFVELRRELESFGYIFRTQTDTEVILASYDRWGTDCQLKFNGMWAFALWDDREQTLFLSRDRFGIKPLYYLSEPGRFAFASEMKAFLYLSDFRPSENEVALRRVLVNDSVLEGTEETLLQGVKRLVGGHCLVVTSAKIKVCRWWNTLDHLVAVPGTLAEQAEQFRELFFDACRLRLRSDVPVATCLSGGVDSSAVLCSLAAINALGTGRSIIERRTKDWQRAFVATFPGTPQDERRYAEIAVQHATAVAHYRPMSGNAALDELNRVIYDCEDIYSTLPAPIWAIYREMRRDGVVVSLDGHGCDEMLAGYGHHLRTALRTTGGFLRTPSRTLDLIDTLYNLYAPDGPEPRPSRIRLTLNSDPVLRFFERAVTTIYRRAQRRRQQWNGSYPSLSTASWVTLPAFDNLHRDCDEETAINALGPLNAHLYRDFHRTILPTILRNFDRCSMAHGIEIRMPFMDWRLVCYAFSLPEESKVGDGFTKRVLREAMRGTMPEAVRTRKNKIGFCSPLTSWFNVALRDWIWEQVNERDFIDSTLWNGPAIRAFVERKRGVEAWRYGECERVWRFLHAHVWRKVFRKSYASSPFSLPEAGKNLVPENPVGKFGRTSNMDIG